MELVPYTFQGTITTLPEAQQPLSPGQSQLVHFTVDAEQLDWIREKIERWFEYRDEVILVDHGTTCKASDGCIVLEWDGYQVDPLFISILENEDFVIDFTVYTRTEGV